MTTLSAGDLPAQMAGGNDIRGKLCFVSPLSEPHQALEDSRAELDRRTYCGRPFERQATVTEIELLRALSHVVSTDLTTRVEYPSPNVRRRTWPALETP